MGVIIGHHYIIVRMDLNADRLALPKVHAVDHRRVQPPAADHF
jgi:hypothetical protein